MNLPKVGKRVRIKSINIKGKIVFIDNQHLFDHHFHPIQVELDKPYDDSGQTMYRTNAKDMVFLKPKVKEAKPKKKKKKTFDDELF